MSVRGAKQATPAVISSLPHSTTPSVASEIDAMSLAVKMIDSASCSKTQLSTVG